MAPLLFNFFFAAVIHAMIRLSEGPDILRDLVHLEEDRVKVDSLAGVQRTVWGVLYAGDACIVSKSIEGLAKMITVIVTVFKAAALTVSETKTENMLLRTQNQAPHTSPPVIEAAGQSYRQNMRFFAHWQACRRKR